MKNDIKYIAQLLILVGLMLSYSQNVFAQEFELSDYKVRFSLNTSKDIDNSRNLEVTFFFSNWKSESN